MRKTFLFCFILSLVLISCNNSDRAKKKIIEIVTTDFKKQNRNVYQKLDSIHIISYDSLTQKKCFGIAYDQLTYCENLYSTTIDLLNNKIQSAAGYLGTSYNREAKYYFNTFIASRQAFADSLQLVKKQMQELSAEYQVADSVQYRGLIVRAVLYITTMDETSVPYNRTIMIDKQNNVKSIEDVSVLKHQLDSTLQSAQDPSSL
ncbi:MAG TPA: hypothetical protein VN721_05640 [Flavipsychrobacter sp.]|nr:hypothetical protein [Flavipsychrobacter sp.]